MKTRYYDPFKPRLFGAQRAAFRRWFWRLAWKSGLRRPRSDRALERMVYSRFPNPVRTFVLAVVLTAMAVIVGLMLAGGPR